MRLKLWRVGATIAAGLFALSCTKGIHNKAKIEKYESSPGLAQAFEPLSKDTSFSKPTGGLSVAVLGPEKALSRELNNLLFEVYILNAGKEPLAFSRHPVLVQLRIYNAKGQIVTRPYGADKLKQTVLQGLTVLYPREMLRTLRSPLSPEPAKTGKGEYKVEALLIRPPADLWSSQIKSILKKDQVHIWNAPEVVSPQIRIKLE